MARPPSYKTAKELQERIDEYLDESQNKMTISGLCYHLGFASRQSFYDLEKKKEFSYTIKRARLRIESHYESKLLTKTSTIGAIFALKNFGWEDTQAILLNERRKSVDDLFPKIKEQPENEPESPKP